MNWLFHQLYLFIAGHHSWSRCWMGLHRWDYPGGHCERCGLCDEILGRHEECRSNTINDRDRSGL